MMRLKELKGNFGPAVGDTIQVYECDQCGARSYGASGGELPSEIRCPLHGEWGTLSEAYMAALDTVDSYMPVRGDRVAGADCGWPSLRTVFASVIPGMATNVVFDRGVVSVKASRASIGFNPFRKGYQQNFLLALDGFHRYEQHALGEDLVDLVVKDLGARHDSE